MFKSANGRYNENKFQAHAKINDEDPFSLLFSATTALMVVMRRDVVRSVILMSSDVSVMDRVYKTDTSATMTR